MFHVKHSHHPQFSTRTLFDGVRRPSEERSLGGNPDTPGIAILDRRRLAQDLVTEPDGRAHALGLDQTHQLQALLGPSILRRGVWRLRHHQLPTPAEERRATFSGERGDAEGTGRDRIEPFSQSFVPPQLLRPPPHHLGIGGGRPSGEPLLQEEGPAFIGVDEDHARRRPTGDQDQAWYATASSEVDDTVRRPMVDLLEDCYEAQCVVDLSIDRHAAEKAQFEGPGQGLGHDGLDATSQSTDVNLTVHFSNHHAILPRRPLSRRTSLALGTRRLRCLRRSRRRPNATVAPSGPGATVRFPRKGGQAGEITTYLEGSTPSERVSTPSISLTVSWITFRSAGDIGSRARSVPELFTSSTIPSAKRLRAAERFSR